MLFGITRTDTFVHAVIWMNLKICLRKPEKKRLHFIQPHLYELSKAGKSMETTGKLLGVGSRIGINSKLAGWVYSGLEML